MASSFSNTDPERAATALGLDPATMTPEQLMSVLPEPYRSQAAGIWVALPEESRAAVATEMPAMLAAVAADDFDKFAAVLSRMGAGEQAAVIFASIKQAARSAGIAL